MTAQANRVAFQFDSAPRTPLHTRHGVARLCSQGGRSHGEAALKVLAIPTDCDGERVPSMIASLEFTALAMPAHGHRSVCTWYLCETRFRSVVLDERKWRGIRRTSTQRRSWGHQAARVGR